MRYPKYKQDRAEIWPKAVRGKMKIQNEISLFKRLWYSRKKKLYQPHLTEELEKIRIHLKKLLFLKKN